MNYLKGVKLTGSLLLFMATFQLSSCQSKSGEFSYSNTVNLNDPIKETEIVMGAGKLNINTHAATSVVLEADFSKEAWKPEMELDQSFGKLSISQPDGKFNSMKDEDYNDWRIKLPKSLESDLNIALGAGEGKINLSDASLNSVKFEAGAGDFDINLSRTDLSALEVNAGVGQITLDLSGARKNNLRAQINGGVGAISLTLPRETGVRIKVNGLGGIDQNDFIKRDGYFVNDQYGKTSESIEVEINGGLGSLALKMR